MENLAVNWWHPNQDVIPDEHITVLERHAINEGFKMKARGATSGSLSKRIDDIDYDGHWRIVNRKS